MWIIETTEVRWVKGRAGFQTGTAPDAWSGGGSESLMSVKL